MRTDGNQLRKNPCGQMVIRTRGKSMRTDGKELRKNQCEHKGNKLRKDPCGQMVKFSTVVPISILRIQKNRVINLHESDLATCLNAVWQAPTPSEVLTTSPINNILLSSGVPTTSLPHQFPFSNSVDAAMVT